MTHTPLRVHLPIEGHLADTNVLPRHPADQAAWIWHPDKAPRESAFLRFRLPFTLAQPLDALIHVTADQRFQLRCDGRDITFGPDRCDERHWTVQTLRLELDPGEHELEALVWYIAEFDGTTSRPGAPKAGSEATIIRPPMAQISWQGGFLLCGEGSLLTTGEAPWVVEDLTPAVEMVRPQMPYYLDVGPSFTIDLGKWSAGPAQPAAIVMPPLRGNPHGVRRPGWSLFPAELAEQQREPWTGGRIRAFRPGWSTGPFHADETRAAEIPAWQNLIDRASPLVVPPHAEWTLLWDLENYHCGYPELRVAEGDGALVEWSWAESLYEEARPEDVNTRSHKGHRGEVIGKIFFGFEDRWRIRGGPEQTAPALWWRCGRYVRLRVKTGAAPLTITGIGLVTTGYPLDRLARWESSDAGWDRLMPLFERSYRIGAHETWTDTPYYEQMCYVGDNLFNALSNYAWFGDARLSRRSIRLYEWSRYGSGLVAERYPSGWRQDSSTFSLLWSLMVRDYAWWRDDAPFIQAMLPGLRSVLAEFDGLACADGLLHHVPGWPFIDWVPEWYEGCGPGVREGDSSIVNLLWVLSHLAAAQVEEAHGDALLAERSRQLARRTFDAIVGRYWDEERGLFLDTPGHRPASEHAQMFALLTGLLDAKKTAACLAALRGNGETARATISASFYLLEALYLQGESAEFHRRLAFWRGLPDQGFTATPEAPEPTRSDSHPWGAHPAWHTLASIAGVRPDAPGFRRVRIAPLPGDLEHFTASVVHPRGLVEVSFRRAAGKPATFTVNLPEGITGDLVFAGQTCPLHAGRNEIQPGA
jgi:hypothetical protein